MSTIWTFDHTLYRGRDYTGKYRGAAHSICILKVSVPSEIHVVFKNGSNYDYHFIIKELTYRFEGKLNVLGKIQERWKNFDVLIEKEFTNIDKDGNESVAPISYKTKVINSTRFMKTSLSNLADILTEGIHSHNVRL